MQRFTLIGNYIGMIGKSKNDLTSNQSVFSIMNSMLKTSPPLGPNFISSSSITSWDEQGYKQGYPQKMKLQRQL